jgi:DNA-binding phage protein
MSVENFARGTTMRNRGRKDRFRNQKYVRGLLKTAFDESIVDGNWKAFGLLLQDIIEAQGGMSTFATKTNLSRQHLYRLCRKNANPTVKTLTPLLATFGCRLTLSY